MGLFRPLTGVYEPSAIQQLPDGRFLVVEDEKAHPFTLLAIHPDGRTEATPLEPGFFQWGDSFWKLDDLEGLALAPCGHLYAITSHSRDGTGDEKKSRDKLVRFRVEGEGVVDTTVTTTLKPALAGLDPVLAAAALVRGVKSEGGLNIEALDLDPDTGHLLLGFRSPLVDGQALIARLENPADAVQGSAAPRFSPHLITLPLGGLGLRGMAYLPALGGHLLIAGPVDRTPGHFQLWFWDREAAPRRVSVDGLAGFEHAEGVCAARIGGRPRIVLVSDDGNRKEGRCARFLVLDPGQLRIAP